MAVSRDGRLVATACRASSLDHAVIRLYDTHDWLEVRPPLKAHTLTVTALQFSPDDAFLLSVGRDRQWAVWARCDGPEKYTLRHANPKGHSRMILSAAWAALAPATFLTAGRDKTVKIWRVGEADVELVGTVAAGAPVTAVACGGAGVFAFGTEAGGIGVGRLRGEGTEQIAVTMVAAELAPAKTVNQIVWRPGRSAEETQQMAVVADDCSLRMYNVEAAA